jgi:hypothetical protein
LRGRHLRAGKDVARTQRQALRVEALERDDDGAAGRVVLQQDPARDHGAAGARRGQGIGGAPAAAAGEREHEADEESLGQSACVSPIGSWRDHDAPHLAVALGVEPDVVAAGGYGASLAVPQVPLECMLARGEQRARPRAHEPPARVEDCESSFARLGRGPASRSVPPRRAGFGTGVARKSRGMRASTSTPITSPVTTTPRT